MTFFELCFLRQTTLKVSMGLSELKTPKKKRQTEYADVGERVMARSACPNKINLTSVHIQQRELAG